MINKLIGKKVFIVNNASIYFNEWGIVKSFDGEYYYVAIANDNDVLPIFDRNELRVPRVKEKGENITYKIFITPKDEANAYIKAKGKKEIISATSKGIAYICKDAITPLYEKDYLLTIM